MPNLPFQESYKAALDKWANGVFLRSRQANSPYKHRDTIELEHSS